jgi:hypothetical protein
MVLSRAGVPVQRVSLLRAWRLTYFPSLPSASEKLGIWPGTSAALFCSFRNGRQQRAFSRIRPSGSSAPGGSAKRSSVDLPVPIGTVQRTGCLVYNAERESELTLEIPVQPNGRAYAQGPIDEL